MDLPPNKQEIFDKLTYRIATGTEGTQFHKIEVIRSYKMITPTIISIPQGHTELIPENYEIVDKRILVPVEFPDPKLELFPEQRVVYDEVTGSCFVNALVGWGKTFTALHIARKLGQKTLVVTHTKALRDQWIKEIRALFGIEPGTIEAGIFNVDSCIVVGNVQSIVRNLPRIEKEFGTVIMDEAHHTPASTFTSIIDKSHAKNRIALSGTIQRKDGKHVLFTGIFGPVMFRPPQNNTLNPVVKLLKTDIKLPGGTNWAAKITGLLGRQDYQELIAAMALVEANKGHKVLVIADRTEFLRVVKDMIGTRAVLIIGDTTDRDAELLKVEQGFADIVCGARQIFAEGISANYLSSVILSVPIANSALLEQIIGRIMRLHEGKLHPEVIDIQFSGSAEKRQNSERISFYMSKGWAIQAI